MPVPAIAAAASFGQSLGQSAASTGVTGLVSGALGQLFGGMNARRQWRYQKKAMALQQQYALEQMQRQSDLSYANWQKQFDYENDWNTPTKVFDRYRQAGVTPAAVLGSSGVGVNATMSGGSAGMPSASGPSGGSPITPGLPVSGDPNAIAQNMLAGSQKNLNDANAYRSRAEGQAIEDKNLGKDYYKDVGELNRQVLTHGVDNAKAVAGMNSHLASIYETQASYASLVTQKEYELLLADYANKVEENRRFRADNDIYIPLMDQIAAADLAYTLACTRAANAGASIDEISFKDLKNQFISNWETPIDIPVLDEDGNPTGKTERMTGKEIYEFLLGADVTKTKQGIVGEGFMNWQRKHPMLMSITDRLVGGAAAATVMRAGRGRQPRGRVSTTHRVDRDGQFVGGTSVETRMIY